MTDAGLRGLKKADNTRIAGWRTVREYLNAASGQPRLYITEDCTELIRCLPALRFDERVCEDAAGTPHEITHAPEALRYALMSREPRPPAGREPFPSIYAFPPPKREREGDYARFINY